MTHYITNIAWSTNPAEEELLKTAGFTKVDVVLSQDKQGNSAYIWFRKRYGAAPITRLQVSFNDEMSLGLSNAQYTKAYQSPLPGSPAVLWYLRGTTLFDTPIVELAVTNNPRDEVTKVKDGWDRVGYDFSGEEKFVYLWVKRAQQTYVCDVTATNSYDSDAELFQKGFFRIDQTTNTIRGYESINFLWYRLTTDAEKAITDLLVSTTALEYHEAHSAGYSRASADLNKKTGGNAVALWSKKEKGKPSVQSILLLLNESAVEPFKQAGLIVSENINITNVKFDGKKRFLCQLKSK